MNTPNRKLIADASLGQGRISHAVRYSLNHGLTASANKAGDYVLEVPDTMSDDQAQQHADIALRWPQARTGTIRIVTPEA